MTWAQTWTIIGVTVAFLFGALGLQGLWLGRYLEASFGALERRLSRIETQLDTIEAGVVGQGERIARLER